MKYQKTILPELADPSRMIRLVWLSKNYPVTKLGGDAVLQQGNAVTAQEPDDSVV
jgi:hypothetical protein